jgi:hypothetical protein
MRLRKIDKFLFWMLAGVILLVFVVLLLATVKPVGAASVCGVPVGQADVVETALTIAGVPHQLYVDARSNPTCAMVGCPKPKTTCLGWRIRISTTGAGYMVGKTYIPARYIDLAFGRTGIFYGVQ